MNVKVMHIGLCLVVNSAGYKKSYFKELLIL